MFNLYDKNGLIFWEQREIEAREAIAQSLISVVSSNLRSQNKAFYIERIEAPLLMPTELLNPNYTNEDVFTARTDLVLRPETTAGSYLYANSLITHHLQKPPLCIYQYGKSFRQEQDQVLKNMRLKEFYQLEFQIIYAESTKCDYLEFLLPQLLLTINRYFPARIEPSDRLPSYSLETTDIICIANNMEIASISRRKDFPGMKVLEVAIGMDRVMKNWLDK